jgi:thymidylate synthase
MRNRAGCDCCEGAPLPTSLSAETVDDLLRLATHAVFEEGVENSANRGGTTEIIGAVMELKNPRARLSRTEKRRRASGAIAELCWYLRGTNDGAAIAFWIPKYKEELEPDGSIHGGYGPRLFGEGADGQIRNIIDLLRNNPGTRRAVIQIFDRHDVIAAPRYLDVPCTCTLQFLLRGGELNLVVNMRSNDAYVGLPFDVFCFTMLQELVARDLGVELGRYIHTAGSLHIYDENRSDAEEFLAEGWQSTDSPMPPMPVGAQWDNVRALLGVEEQLRSGTPIKEIAMPESPYWEDLGRVLAHRIAVHMDNTELAQSVTAGFHNVVFAEFA